MDSRQKLVKKDEKEERAEILSALAVKQNEAKFSEFQACVQALKTEFECDIISGINLDEVTAFKEILGNLTSITSPDATEKGKKNKYVLKMDSVIECLKNLTADLKAMKSPTTPGDDIAQLEIARRNKTNFYLSLHHLSKSLCYCLRQTEKTKLKLTSFLPAVITPILAMSIPTILFICGVLVNPIGLIFGGVVAACLFVFFVTGYFDNIRELLKPSFHPIKDTISALTKKISENIRGYQSQLSLVKRNQQIQTETELVRDTIKTRRDTFFGIKLVDHKNSPCYKGLVDKQAVKLASLQENLVRAQNELEAVQTALKCTEELIKDGNEEAVKTYEKKLLSYASVESVPDDIKTLGKNRHQQTIAVRLCAKKIEALQAAIEHHQSEHYVDTKYHQYRNEKYPEAAVDKVSLKNNEASVYGHKERSYYHEYYNFRQIPLEVKPHKNDRRNFLYIWSKDEKTDIRLVNSVKVNIELRRELETIQEAVETERKQWAGI